MKKVILQIMVIVITLSLLCTNSLLIIYAKDQTSKYEILTEYFSEETTISDERIIVVLDNESSVLFKSFDAELQKIVECSSINDLTAFKTQKIKAYIESQSNDIQSNTCANRANNIELDKYHKILCLTLKFPSKEKVLDAVETLNELDGVLFAFPDFEISIASSAITSGISQMEISPDEIYNLISLNQAWSAVSNISQNTVRVAVIDTGINEDHTALYGKVDESTSADFTNYFGDNTDFDDYVNIEAIDNHGHGTHVAGIIAASYDSLTGTEGVCSSVELISIKVLNEQGKGSFADLVTAMAYVTSLDATSDAIDIVNISIEAADFFSQELNQLLLTEWIEDYNGLVVCAAGNSNQDLDDVNVFPASIDGCNIITVGASDADDTRWVSSNLSGSNYNGSVDIFAPGVDIVSCVPIGTGAYLCSGDNCTKSAHIAAGYHTLTGTSMATPFVTGVAALMLSVNSSLDAESIKDIIVDTENTDYSANSSNPLHDLYMICSSGGRLNAYKAVSAVLPTSCSHSSIYYTSTALTHTIHCNNCDYTASEPHDNRYLTVSPERHVYVCRDCGYGIYESHTPQYTIYSDEEHTVICSDCGYTTFAYHEFYMYENNGEDGCIIKCYDCSYTLECAETAEYEIVGSSGHNVICPEGCYYLFEVHNLDITEDYNSNGHILECSDCGYTETADHDLYMYSAETEDYVVKCRDCDYSVRCVESPEYYGNNADGHWVDCPDGCYSLFEAHTPGRYTDIDEPSHKVVCADCGYTYYEDHNYGDCYYTSNANYHYYECVDCGYDYAQAHIFNRSATDSLYTHAIECMVCGYESIESHTWISSGMLYRCTDCGMISDSYPGIMSLPDPELELYLSSLSEEELDLFLASLPEEELARITALLPPENEDEFLTE